MNIDKVKNKIKSLENHNLKIKIYLGRNKYEYLDGKIYKIYNNLFTIKTNKGIRTFSYSDVVTKVVEISKI